MSLIFIDGFDHQSLARAVITGGSGFATGRFSGSSLRLDGQDSPVRYSILHGQHSDIVLGFALFPEAIGSNASSSNNKPIQIGSDNGATVHITWNFHNDGSAYFRRGDGGTTTVIASAPSGTITGGVWQYIELRLVLHDTAGVAQMRLNGALAIDASGVDTKNAGSKTVFDFFQFAMPANTSGAGDVLFDDVYCVNAVDATSTQGRPNNTFLGDCRVATLVPNADASPLQWSPSTGTDHYAVVDEMPASDADYITTTTGGQIDMFGFGDLSDLTHDVYGVQATYRAAKVGTGNRSVKLRIDSDSNVQTFDERALGTGFVTHWDILGTDPDGNGAWTPAQVNGLLAGVESV